jgi:hypothetical protein
VILVVLILYRLCLAKMLINPQKFFGIIGAAPVGICAAAPPLSQLAGNYQSFGRPLRQGVIVGTRFSQILYLASQAASSPAAMLRESSVSPKAPLTAGSEVCGEESKIPETTTPPVAIRQENQPVRLSLAEKPIVRIQPSGCGQVIFPSSSGHSFKGFSMAEARKLGLV